MNKLSIAILSITCCTQQMHTMQLGTPSSDDCGYTIITKNMADRPAPTPISKKFNPLSEKLYDKNITDTQIRELVKQGAELNYQKQGYNGPVIFCFACNNSPQGIKNMKTMIELGAAIHNIQGEGHTPLTITLQRGYDNINGEKKYCPEMLQLLIPYENPIVTVYKKTEYHDGEPYSWTTDNQEEKIRIALISHSLYSQDITTIKMLLDRKLVTPNGALKEFARLMKPNQEVLNLLFAYGADNTDDLLPAIMDSAFPLSKNNTYASTQYIRFLKQMCASNTFNREVFRKMLDIQKDVNAIVTSLAANQNS